MFNIEFAKLQKIEVLIVELPCVIVRKIYKNRWIV